MKIVKINNTLCFVNTGKVVSLIQNGKFTQDPLRVRYFQNMLKIYA